jgi:hypothetical protein
MAELKAIPGPGVEVGTLDPLGFFQRLEYSRYFRMNCSVLAFVVISLGTVGKVCSHERTFTESNAFTESHGKRNVNR